MYMSLRDIRRKRLVSQGVLADQTGIARTTISRLETGDIDISKMELRNAIILADALDVKDLRELLDTPIRKSKGTRAKTKTYKVEATPDKNGWKIWIQGVRRGTTATDIDEIDSKARELIQIETGKKNFDINVVMTLSGGTNKYKEVKNLDA